MDEEGWSTRARVLLAEDDAEFRALLAGALRADGLHVVEVEDGRALLDELTRSLSSRGELMGFDLVVTDIRMPGYSALDVLTGARKALVRTPVIVMTAFGDRSTHEKARQLGTTAFFDKPFSIDEFRTVARKTVRDKLLHDA
jgi:DNA-binding response OmpR family regulator